jgi:hypothetical protein
MVNNNPLFWPVFGPFPALLNPKTPKNTAPRISTLAGKWERL